MWKQIVRFLNFRRKGREDVLWQLANSTHLVDRWLAENPEVAATARWIKRDVNRAFAGIEYDTRGHMTIDVFREIIRRKDGDFYRG